MSQTTIKNSNAIQFGSGKFEYSKDGSTWTDLGAMVNIVFTETFDKVTVMSDNAGVIKERIKNCLLYTSDAADDLLCVDLGGRRIIKKKKQLHITHKLLSTNLIIIFISRPPLYSA